MKIFKQSTGEIDTIKKNAKKVGLDQINYTKRYLLIKLSSKNQSPYNYPDTFEVTTGTPEIVGDDKFVWLYFGSSRNNIIGHFDWFKTSPILKVKKIKDGFKLETENSFYKLEEVNE